MKLYFFLVVAGLQWCYSTQQSSQLLVTGRLFNVNRESGYRAKQELTFSSERKLTNFRKDFPWNTIPDSDKLQTERRHRVTKREVTAEDIIKKLPRVYEPGSATRYSYATENARSLADQEHLFESNVNVANEKSIEFETAANEYPRNSTINKEGKSEIEISITGQVESTTAIPTSPPTVQSNNGYNFLLKQLQQYRKKSDSKTEDTEKSSMKLSRAKNYTIHESHEENSTIPFLHTSEALENETFLALSTAETEGFQTANTTFGNQQTLENDAVVAEHGDGSLPPHDPDDEHAQLLPPEVSTSERGRPRIIFPDSSMFDLKITKSHDETTKNHDEAIKSHDETTKSHDEANKSHDEAIKSHDETIKRYGEIIKSYDEAIESHDETIKNHDEAENGNRKSHPIFKIKDPLIYANSSKMLANITFKQIISADISSNTTNLATHKTNMITHQPETLNENYKPDVSSEPSIYQNSSVISLAANKTSPIENMTITSNITFGDANNNTSLLQKSLVNVENQTSPLLSENPEFIQNSSNTAFDQSTTLQNETSSEIPLTSPNQNFTGLLQSVPVSPARLLPQNLFGFDFHPSKSFNLHSTHTPTQAPGFQFQFPSSPRGISGLDGLGFGPWNPPSYLPNAGNADFTSAQHFSPSALGLPGSLGGLAISQNPSTLGGVDLGGLDFLSLLSSLGGFNSPSVPTSVDFSLPSSIRSPYSIGGTSNSFQNTPISQLVLKRFGLPETKAAGEAFESTALAGVHSSLESPFTGEAGS